MILYFIMNKNDFLNFRYFIFINNFKKKSNKRLGRKINRNKIVNFPMEL